MSETPPDAASMANICPCCASRAVSPAAPPAYTRCAQCGHRWRPPQQGHDRHYYAGLIDRNDPQTPWFKRKIAERTDALSRLLTPNVKRVLEVGCAEGALGEAIKTRFAVTYEGIELSQDAERAQAKLDRVYRTPAALTAAPPYDLIVSFHVLEHIATPAKELQAWSKLLVPEGKLLIEVPHEAGHPWLTNDHNPEHLHQFTPASLTTLLAQHAFTVQALTLGHYESPVYPDSIRVIAQRRLEPLQQRERLLQRFRSKIGGPFIAYGIGGDFQNYVLPLADALEIKALVDTSPEKWGLHIGKRRISAYDPEQHSGLPILVCSIKYGTDIKEKLRAMGVAPARIIGLEEIYETP